MSMSSVLQEEDSVSFVNQGSTPGVYSLTDRGMHIYLCVSVRGCV